MGRYYDIQIFKSGTSTLIKEYTSYPKINGKFQNDPGALNIVIDAYVYSMDAPTQLPTIKIWGVPIQDIMQASNFTKCDIKVFGGFTAGLPLNNPKQAGPLLSGWILQSFANWLGVEMTLDFVVVLKGATQAEKSNIALSWLTGMPLAQALTTTFTNAFPGIKQTINIDTRLVANHDISGTYTSLVQLNQTLRLATQELLGGSYPGVRIIQTAAGINVQDGGVEPGATTTTTITPKPAGPPAGSFVVPASDPRLLLPANQGGYPGSAYKNPDGTYTVTNDDGTTVFGAAVNPITTTTQQVSNASQPAAVQLAFQDFIGQPTWLDFGTIQFVCPMRADLSVTSIVTMPKGLLGNPANPVGAPGAVVTTSASTPQARQGSIFSGTFFITSVHHMGEFRNPDGQAWVTVFNASPTLLTPGPVS